MEESGNNNSNLMQYNKIPPKSPEEESPADSEHNGEN
jgi:hypothetical protein